ncbi:hypothetical protein [uncultured Piscinibacter sp.]|uniref:hypothetical protein n=1 Tax=uncultured Piscinibacter sp. TaxID=1131835 RepID=UPI0026327643|nr:hypothetical protein [uncultured Piscinibacter sp.]
MQSAEILETATAALLFAAAFAFGGRVHPLRSLVRDRRSVISFGAGMSAAYVFVHLMPELTRVRRVFAASASVPLRYEGMSIYFLALLGFLVFYALDHLRTRLREPGPTQQGGPAFRLHVGGFAVYVWLLGYLLVRDLEDGPVSIGLYTLAITCHLMAVDNELRREHGDAYERVGRFVLAGASLAGWATGVLLELPPNVVALLLAFLSGAIIMNSAIMELPSERDGRFLPFMIGGVVYGLILIPLG